VAAVDEIQAPARHRIRVSVFNFRSGKEEALDKTE
jgi:hypothetical protein